MASRIRRHEGPPKIVKEFPAKGRDGGKELLDAPRAPLHGWNRPRQAETGSIGRSSRAGPLCLDPLAFAKHFGIESFLPAALGGGGGTHLDPIEVDAALIGEADAICAFLRDHWDVSYKPPGDISKPGVPYGQDIGVPPTAADPASDPFRYWVEQILRSSVVSGFTSRMDTVGRAQARTLRDIAKVLYRDTRPPPELHLSLGGYSEGVREAVDLFDGELERLARAMQLKAAPKGYDAFVRANWDDVDSAPRGSPDPFDGPSIEPFRQGSFALDVSPHRVLFAEEHSGTLPPGTLAAAISMQGCAMGEQLHAAAWDAFFSAAQEKILDGSPHAKATP